MRMIFFVIFLVILNGDETGLVREFLSAIPRICPDSTLYTPDFIFRGMSIDPLKVTVFKLLFSGISVLNKSRVKLLVAELRLTVTLEFSIPIG